jgi:hypothetical protein
LNKFWKNLGDYLKRLWHEVEPVFNHTLVAASIAVLVALLIKFFGAVLPTKIADELHKIDQFLIVSIFWFLAVYTLILLGIRLIKHLIVEIRGKKRGPQTQEQEANLSDEASSITSLPDPGRLLESGENVIQPGDIHPEQAKTKQETER